MPKRSAPTTTPAARQGTKRTKRTERASPARPASSTRRAPQAFMLPPELIAILLAYLPLPVTSFLATLSASFKQASDIHLRRALRADPSHFASAFFNAYFRIPRLIGSTEYGNVHSDFLVCTLPPRPCTYHPATLAPHKHRMESSKKGPQLTAKQWADLVDVSKQALIDDTRVVIRSFRGLLVDPLRDNTPDLDTDLVLALGEKFYTSVRDLPHVLNTYDRDNPMANPVIYPRLLSNMYLCKGYMGNVLTATGIFFNMTDNLNRFIKRARLMNPRAHPVRGESFPIINDLYPAVHDEKFWAMANQFMDFLVGHGLTEDLRTQCTITAQHSGYLHHGQVYPTPVKSRPSDRFDMTTYSWLERKIKRRELRKSICRITSIPYDDLRSDDDDDEEVMESVSFGDQDDFDYE
jgi:hypothetical protein